MLEPSWDAWNIVDQLWSEAYTNPLVKGLPNLAWMRFRSLVRKCQNGNVQKSATRNGYSNFMTIIYQIVAKNEFFPMI